MTAKAAVVALVTLCAVGTVGCRSGDRADTAEHGFTAVFPVSSPPEVMDEAVRRCGALPGIGKVIDRTRDSYPSVNVVYDTAGAKEAVQTCFRDAGATITIGG